MFKITLLSLFVLGCSALPATYNYRSGSYGQSSRIGGSGLGYSAGIGYGASGYSGNLGRSYSGYIGGGSSIPVASYSVAPVATTTLAVQPVATSYSTTGYNGGLNYQNFLTVRQGQTFEPVVPAAIQQISRTVEYTALPNQEQAAQQQIIEIEPSDNPVHLHFKTRSSTLSASQSHEAAQAGEVQTASAQDEVQRLYTEVQKPVIQEVKEVITPFRQVTQLIHPVQESLHTVVTKGEGRRQQYVANQAYQSYSQAVPAIGSYSVARPVGYQAVGYQAQPVIGYQASSSLVPAVSTYSGSSNYRLGGSVVSPVIGSSVGRFQSSSTRSY